jgi:hypothetical protein
LVERVQRRALDVLGQAVLLGDPVQADNAGYGRGLGQALLLDSSSNARKRRPPAGISYMPVSIPAASSTGRTVMDCSKVRRAMSSASCSMDTPALMRRTLQALSSSLFKGMSREALRVIF